ncbi:hypothetical protein [Paracoccus aestuariivivens]|uniref:Uncharacterized protein n=1 Tax=Paracoccus aestuariivivens TaxID=1820333 RepID=A0A6L6JIC3_9RHOB|nr:hypothetical protein [Paracoccus aestuariivivens]MTH80327.1 hypothetical protein [Paracoccus aestuariivivens]
MKQPENDGLSYFEARIARELAAVEDEIRKLEAEAVTLRRQLGKAKAERLGLQHATRKNSMNRVLTENSVLEQLRSTSPIATKVLFRNAKMSHPDLKETTFRTYLHRMKQRGLIKTARSAGQWELAQAAPAPSPWEEIISRAALKIKDM